MEDKSHSGAAAPWIALTAVAPIAWGSTYFVTRHLLPADSPIWGAVIRCLPAGILLGAMAGGIWLHRRRAQPREGDSVRR